MIERISVLFFFIIIIPLTAQSEEWIIKYEIGQSENDVRMPFKLAVLEGALSRTEEQYGSYRIISLVSNCLVRNT